MPNNEENNKRNKILTISVISFLILVFIVGFVWGLNSVLAMEGQFEPVITKSSVSPPPLSGADADTYLEKLVEKASEEMPKTNDSIKFRINTDTIETSGSDELKATLEYLSDPLEDYVEGLFESTETDFFKPVNIRTPVLTPADIKDFTCDYIYYECPSCGEQSDVMLDSCEKCGSTYPYQEKLRDEYDITLSLNPDSKEILDNNFTPRTDEEIDAILKHGLENVAEVKDFTVEYKDLSLNFKANRLNDELSYIRYTKVMDIYMILEFKGDYAALGSSTVKFEASEEMNYNLTWPSLKLNKEQLVMEPKNTDNLLATLTCDDPTAYTVKWTSLNPGVVEVDDEGYLKATKEIGSSVIIAEFEFGGHTYSDRCAVTVEIPVESMKLSKSSIKLNAGENYTLTAKVSPRDATVKAATWYTEDDSIATVDQNGTVTAVKTGTVTVYALSDDGYYKSSCEVTVR